MGKIAKVIRCVAFLLFAVSQHSLAQTPDVSGKWTGKTVCPLGPVAFTLDVEDRTGTFSHSGYGPDKVNPASFPVEIWAKTGWEGEWVYFQNADHDAQASFSNISGLLSTDGRTLLVRGAGIGDCREFKLTKAAFPRSQPSSTPAVVVGPPQGHEPTEEEMRAAALARKVRGFILEGRKLKSRELDFLSESREHRRRLLRLLEKANSYGHDGQREEVLDIMRDNNAWTAKLEGTAPGFFGLRLLNGQVAMMSLDGRYIVLKSEPPGAIDPVKLPRPGDQVLPQELEDALLEYEQVWTGVDAEQAEVRTALQSLNALIGEYTCDKKVFGYFLSTRNTATEETALAVDVHGVMRFRSQLGNSRDNAWSEREDFAPLARMQVVELHIGQDGDCSTIHLRCVENRRCALDAGEGSEIATTAALSIDFTSAENATQAADLLGELVQRYSASGSR